MQIALADFPEDARQRSRLMRKEDQQRREQEKASKAAQIEAELEERINAEDETTNETVAIEDDASLEEATENETTKAKTGISKRNTVTLTLTAQTSMRYGLSVRGTSAVCSSYLLDLINGGILSPSKIYLAVDPRKLRRARDRVLSEASEKGNELTDQDDIKCVMFDSRLDQTKVRLFDKDTGKYYPTPKAGGAESWGSF